MTFKFLFDFNALICHAHKVLISHPVECDSEIMISFSQK